MNNHTTIRQFIKSRKILYLLLMPFVRVYKRLWGKKEKSAIHTYNSIIDRIEEGHVLIPIPEFEGSFYIDIRSHILSIIIIEKTYEPELVEIVKQNINSNRDVIDVGANIGLFTVLFSKLISKKQKVLAIEPTPSATKYLHLNIEKNNVNNLVIVFNGVASAEKGDYSINVIPGKEEYSSIGTEISHPIVKKYKSEKILVKGDSIDNLVIEYKINPGFIKIDVEGSEYSVIKGAKNTLLKYKPVIVAELYDILLSNCGHTSENVVTFLESIEYNVIDIKRSARPTFPFCGEILATPKNNNLLKF